MSNVRIIPSLWIVSLAGCAIESASHRVPDVADSAGVRIVTNYAPQWLDHDTWPIAAEPRLVIGGPNVAETRELYQVAGALKRGDRIIIANAGTHEIRFYDGDGRLRSRIGGEGDGPGEFRRIARPQRMGGDSLMVFDGAARRVTVLGGDGGFGRTVRLAGPPGAWVVPHGGFADGPMLASEMVAPGLSLDIHGKPAAPEIGRSRASLTLRVYNVDGSMGDSVGFDHSQEMYRELLGRRIRPWPPPFRRQPMTIAHDDRFATGSMDVYEIRVSEPSGRLSLLVRRADPLRPMSPRLLEAEVARVTASLPEEFPGRASARSNLLEAGAPDHLPTVGSNILTLYPTGTGLVFDAADNLWIQEYPGPTSMSWEWSVVDPEGVWMGYVSVPTGRIVLDVSDDDVLLHWRDELDVEYVGLFDLIKP